MEERPDPTREAWEFDSPRDSQYDLRTVCRRPGSQLRKLVARSRAGIDTSTVRQHGRLTDQAIGAAWKARGTACGVGIVLSAFRQKGRSRPSC